MYGLHQALIEIKTEISGISAAVSDESLFELVREIRENLGAKDGDVDNTIAARLDSLIANLGSTADDDCSIGTLLCQIRNNLGSRDGDGDNTIAQRLDKLIALADKIYQDIPSSGVVEDKLETIASSIQSIDIHT
jgi:hypothetical protein